MIFVMVPILPAEAAGLEDTERVEILELVESFRIYGISIKGCIRGYETG